MHRHHDGSSQHLISRESTHALAQGLGWFSIGLGLAQLLAPRRVGEFLGTEEHTNVIQACGAREVATGIGILTAQDPTPWLWGRVAGDALDLATLVPAVRDNPKKGNVLFSIAAVAGIAALDLICVQELNAQRREQQWQRRRRWIPDYSSRSGFPKGVEQTRGAARDFEVPRDMRIPEALRPWKTDRGTAAAASPRSPGSLSATDTSTPAPKPQISSTTASRVAAQTQTRT
ncbi:cyclase dehydrase [Geminicoccus roseus]|uniref:cyclase dehydrase n=1 Tax=Geminicoccus roseus TaxID=404900 RepID=UPI00040F04F3|nr:cyclase dehydrase [Geminicoccus roseus]